MEKVSIVIPVYNCARYIEEAIDSALNQDYPRIEVIVVDDGSTDETPAILKSYGNKIKVVTQKNGHTGSAMNAGIKVMTGEWFKELQADDRLFTDCVSRMMKHVKDKEDTIYYGNVNWIDEFGNTKIRIQEKNYNSLSKKEFNTILLQHNIGNGTSLLVHKSAFEKHGVFDVITKHEDYQMRLNWCILQNCRMTFIDERVAEYRLHPSQYTKSRTMETILDEDQRIKLEILSKISIKEQEDYAMRILHTCYDIRQHPQLFEEKNLIKVLGLYNKQLLESCFKQEIVKIL